MHPEAYQEAAKARQDIYTQLRNQWDQEETPTYQDQIIGYNNRSKELSMQVKLY